MRLISLIRQCSNMEKRAVIASPYEVCAKFRDHKAITDQHGVHTYGDMWSRSVEVANMLRTSAGESVPVTA